MAVPPDAPDVVLNIVEHSLHGRGASQDDFPGSGSGARVVRAEPMSTLDAELNDFGAQLAMLRGHAADRDG